MTIKGIIDYDIVNYKKPSLFICFPYCSFKCGEDICQNHAVYNEPNLDVSMGEIINIYDNNPLTKAIVCGGMEPFDSEVDLQCFITAFRDMHTDDIVVYTGYTEDEVREKFPWATLYENIIIKYGRYVPNQKPHKDNVLGVELASDNQYAKEYNFK